MRALTCALLVLAWFGAVGACWVGLGLGLWLDPPLALILILTLILTLALALALALALTLTLTLTSCVHVLFPVWSERARLFRLLARTALHAQAGGRGEQVSSSSEC